MEPFFVETFDPSRPSHVLSWMREDFDGSDPWGWVMSWLFDVNAALYARPDDDGAITALCHYQPGAFGPEVDPNRAPGLALIPTPALQRVARALNAYDDKCRAAGLNY